MRPCLPFAVFQRYGDFCFAVSLWVFLWDCDLGFQTHEIVVVSLLGEHFRLHENDEVNEIYLG